MYARVFRVEVADELRGIVREPTALFFSVVMPVAFFALFVSIFGDQASGSLPAGTRMIATFGTFGVLAVALVTPGVGVAQDREIGWLRAKRVSAVPLGLTVAAKVAAALPYALTVLVAMAVTAGLTGTLDASAVELLGIAGVLIAGCLPFALLALAVGFQTKTNAAVAILQAILMPSAVLSGLWMPLEIMPAFIGDLAHFLPTYHLSQLALSRVDGSGAGQVLGHAGVLAATGAVTAVLAAVSYRHARL